MLTLFDVLLNWQMKGSNVRMPGNFVTFKTNEEGKKVYLLNIYEIEVF